VLGWWTCTDRTTSGVLRSSPCWIVGIALSAALGIYAWPAPRRAEDDGDGWPNDVEQLGDIVVGGFLAVVTVVSSPLLRGSTRR
jgi:hypothetical protein